MQVAQKAILESVEDYAKKFFEQHIPEKYAYHNLQHTINVVNAVKEICALEEVTAENTELLEIAAWFHDTGYNEGAEGHEQRSADYAAVFLRENNYSATATETIKNCILATKYPQAPNTLFEKILCDADLSHLGKDNYWMRCGKVREELALVKSLVMNEEDWIDFELEFMKNHQFQTEIGLALYEKHKQKHIKQLIKQKARLNPKSLSAEETALIAKKKDKKKKKNKSKDNGGKKEINQIRLGRGVETMYRTTYRTHVNLSSIADNKANIMLSINAIIVSISVSTLVPNFGDNPKLIIPTLLLLFVCLASIVFATLSTMPKVTEGIFTREDIRQKKSNLLFFGNFYNMKMDDFHWGMMEMIKDSDFLYSSMTRDLYFLGKVLAKKYSYLRTCYRIFMYGLIIAVTAFAFSFIAMP
ncbi:MAG: Pycsar system effector family protein [Saprospiraceae bacterium]